MNAEEAIISVLKAAHMSQAACAESMGWTRQKFHDKIHRGSMRVDEFFEILDKAGVQFQMVNIENGKVVNKFRERIGPHGRCMINGVIYDTNKAHSIADTFYEDGENEYNKDGTASELFLTQDGSYLLAEYSQGEEKVKLKLVDDSFVSDYIVKHQKEA